MKFGPKVVALAEAALGDRNPLLAHLEQAVPRRRLRAFGRTATPFPVPPVVVAGLTVQRAPAGDGDVALFERVDERRVVHQLDALPAREDRRQVGARIGREQQRRALRHVQVDAAAQVNRAGEVASWRHDDAPAAGLGARRDRLADRLRAVGRSVRLRAVVGDREVARGKRGGDDPGQDRVHVGPRAGGRCGRRRLWEHRRRTRDGVDDHQPSGRHTGPGEELASRRLETDAGWFGRHGETPGSGALAG